MRVIVCGDLNVAHKDIDIHNPNANVRNAGFTKEERKSFDDHLIQECGLIDAFRMLNPSTIRYSWWSAFGKSRESNKGWRIDYMLIKPKIIAKSCDILIDVTGSDHAPVMLDT